jgi:DNA-binding LacI/PurR family transcriptional regulator
VISGYRPNLMARALSEGKSSMLALVLPDIVNPFYPEFVRVAERVARQRNYFLMVCNTDERPDIGRAYLQQIAGTLADGVLVLHAGIGAADIHAMKTRHAPIVLASEEEVDLANAVPHVVVNFQRAGEIAAEHLLQLGHQNIGVILGQGLEGMQVGRFAGFEARLRQAGLVLAPQHICSSPDTIKDGYEAALKLLDATPALSAIFATNDLMAYGASQALADRGIRVPQDISLVGITDIQLARNMRPALTTVSLAIEAMATLSINLLLDLIANPAHEPHIVYVPDPQLVVRQSTGPAR